MTPRTAGSVSGAAVSCSSVQSGARVEAEFALLLLCGDVPLALRCRLRQLGGKYPTFAETALGRFRTIGIPLHLCP
jgi:hypothetical protein